MEYGVSGVDVPERIGVYAVERELGAGGMGTVYLARSRGGRSVAVKVARPELAADPHFRARFGAEVAAARRVGGFHTAQVVDADPEAPAPWLATAYIPGPTLAALLGAEGPMGEERLRQLGAALAEALAAIHGCGLVHRDLKPSNIIMAPDGPRVLDFGIARAMESSRLTSTGVAFGTPGFLAPEQAQGEEVGGAADVFALGAVLVAAAGGSAFGGGTPMGLMYRAVHEPADLSAVPAGLWPVLASCLAKDPAQRPTPERLLDLLAPDPTAYSPTVYAPAVAVPRQPAEPVPVHQAPTETAPARPGPEQAGGGPVFTAADVRSAVLIDAGGVLLESDTRSLHFGWDRISAVDHTAEPRKHLMVTVRLHDGTAHQQLVHARRTSRLKEWLEDLPLILDCFR
ncbi:protein kinase [Streptomyces finlayi]|uniref:Protein kinase n=1 Tax=Streptomyces finlayi TaxID=67296 RepID=A0A7G7BUY2_9ACTN|nr:serine/threonine-protein kinase [Streptomyces finlayi]QNE79147.1 protein kinase [Streptomyces finlayi]